MAETRLQFSGYEFAQLFDAAHLARLDAEFIASLKAKDSVLWQQLQNYRNQSQPFTREDTSQLLISVAEHLSTFLSTFFNIDQPVENLKSTILRDAVIFQFKENIVLRMAKRKVSNHNIDQSFNDLNQWVIDNIESNFDIEWGVAEFAMSLLKMESREIERLVDWCVLALSTKEGQDAVQGWASFKLPAKLDYQNLVNLDPIPEDPYQRVQAPESHQRQRDGFSLTDEGMTRREVLSEVHYCVNCHTNEGDFCSQGFPVKKREPELELK